MQFSSKRLSHALLAAAIVVVAGIPTVQAQDTDVARLEARVAELEALVRQLVAERSAKTAPAPAPAPAPEVVPSSPSKTTYSFGGYVKADAMWSDYSAGDLAPGSAGTQFYIPATIPVGGVGEGYDADFQARETRLNFTADHETEGGDKLKAFVEMDFFLSPGGDERISNSYNPRLRHAFIQYNNWLVGQTWMTFQDVSALPDLLDFVGPSEGTVFGRQDMIRYTNGPWEFAIENPETTVTPFGGGTRIVTDDGPIPDVVARYTAKLNNGYVKIAGLARQLFYDTGVQDDSETALGISVSGKHMFGRDDLRWMATYGSGIGRYLGLNTSNDAVLDASGNLEAIDEFGGFVAFRHFWDAKWHSSFVLSYLAIDNDTALTGLGVTKDVYSIHANLLYEPVPKLMVGGEIMYAEREIESGLDGDMTRFLFSAKYGF